MARTVEQCRELDVNWCNDGGVFADGGSGTITWTSENGDENSVGYRFRAHGEPDILELRYSSYNRFLDDEPRDVVCTIPIDYTECHFGGERPWFRCPKCNDRVGKLYSTARSVEYICRDCGGLIYRSQESANELVEAFRAKREARARFRNNPFAPGALRDVYDSDKDGRETIRRYFADLDDRYGGATASPLRDTLISPDQHLPFEEWADRLFYRGGRSPGGRRYGYHGRCTATSKTTGERCRQPARGDHGKCYYHGGAEGSGIGEGQTDHAAEAIREAFEKSQTTNARLTIGQKGPVR